MLEVSQVEFRHTSSVTKCGSNANVTGNSQVGAFTGLYMEFWWNTSVSDCYATGSVVANGGDLVEDL